MSILALMIKNIFLVYTLLLMVRIIGSWFPRFASHQIMHFVVRLTEPYLGLFRKILPPIGGMLDLSPMLAFFALQIVEKILLAFVH